jgi:PAS domain S-box-containing protein
MDPTENNAYLNSLFENSPEAIVLLDKHNRVLRANPEFCRLFGYRKSEIEGQHIDTLITSEVEFQEASDFSARAEGGEHLAAESTRRRKDGRPVEVSILGAPIEVEGQVVGIFGIYRDISDRKQVEHELKTSLREKEVLLQEVHHRVKNNMQIISSLLNLEAMNLENVHSRELLYVIQNRIQAMSLVHEKLYSTEHIEVVDLADYTRDLCLQVLDVVSREDKLGFDFNLQTVYSEIDFSVPYGLIVNELVMNSYKHAFKGVSKPEIQVELHKKPTGIVLKVCDNGVGLPADFDIEESPTLGMKLINSLIVQLSGALSYTKERGTTWEIFFPHEMVNLQSE